MGERVDHRRGIVNYGETYLRRYASRPFAREEAVVPERLDVPVRIRGGGLGGMVITVLGRMRGGGVPPNLQLSVAPLVFGRSSKSVL